VGADLVPRLAGGGALVVVLALLLRVYWSTDKTRVTQVREVVAEAEDLRRAKEQLETRLDEARHQLREALSAASIAETHVAQLNIEIKYLQESIGRLEAEIKQLRGDISA
jgi:predicted  nucleic acid-binding Zn-ribbon protein